MLRVSIAITGSSGVRVAFKVMDGLRDKASIDGIIVTRGAMAVARYEEGLDEQQLLDYVSRYGPVYMEDDFTSPLASSSSQPDAMVIVPASMKTVGLIANGIPSNLVSRASLAILRLGRRLVIAPRETPLGVMELRNLLRLAEAGAVIVPLTLAFYNRPESLDDVVGFAAGKVLDALGIDAGFYRRWRRPAGLE